jgi:GNAT superfamily N-acetyltransferase
MIRYQQSKSFVEAFNVLPILSSLTELYPDFEYWYVNTMIPGLITGNDILLLAKEHEQIVGVALGKVTTEETKLRCVRVLPSYQNKGTGLHLIEHMLKLLDTDKPLCTVAEEMFHSYSRAFINHFDFDLSSVDKGKYRAGKLEYIFN